MYVQVVVSHEYEGVSVETIKNISLTKYGR